MASTEEVGDDPCQVLQSLGRLGMFFSQLVGVLVDVAVLLLEPPRVVFRVAIS